MPHAHITKIEDARTGQWLRHLDPITDPIKRIDMGWTMGDWNQLDVTTETVGLRESSFSCLPLLIRLLALSPTIPCLGSETTPSRRIPSTPHQDRCNFPSSIRSLLNPSSACVGT